MIFFPYFESSTDFRKVLWDLDGRYYDILLGNSKF